jgi:hypothetical protein
MNKTINEFQRRYRFLSNFWIEPDGTCVESEYQATKSDPPTTRILRLSPGQAKYEGRRLLLRPDWDQVKIPIMKELVKKKFIDHELLRSWLLETSDAELIEGNSWGDIFWGVDTRRGGLNHLGKILMEVRNELQGER